MLTNGLHRHTIVIRISTLLLESKSDMFTNSCFYQNLLIYLYRSKSLQARWDFEPVSAALYDQAVVVAKLVMRRFTNSRGPRFKSSHGQKLSVYFQPYWKDENKEKEAGNGQKHSMIINYDCSHTDGQTAHHFDSRVVIYYQREHLGHSGIVCETVVQDFSGFLFMLSKSKTTWRQVYGYISIQWQREKERIDSSFDTLADKLGRSVTLVKIKNWYFLKWLAMIHVLIH